MAWPAPASGRPSSPTSTPGERAGRARAHAALASIAWKRAAAGGPLQPLATVWLLVRAAVLAARQAVPGAGSCWGGRLRRLHCGARLRVVPANSLRSLRSLRSDRRRQVRSRSALRAPTRTLRSSSPQKSPAPSTTCRAGTTGDVRRGAPPSFARSGRWRLLRNEAKGETAAARPSSQERARTRTVLRTVLCLASARGSFPWYERSSAPRRPDPAPTVTRVLLLSPQSQSESQPGHGGNQAQYEAP